MAVLALFIETIDAIAVFCYCYLYFSHLSDIISAETLNLSLGGEYYMSKGIMIIGPSGSGKTSLGKWWLINWDILILM